MDPKVFQAVFLAQIDSSLRQLLSEVKAQADQGGYTGLDLDATTHESFYDFERDYPYTKVRSLDIVNDSASDLRIRINDGSQRITITTGRSKPITYNRKVISTVQFVLTSGTGTVRITATW